MAKWSIPLEQLADKVRLDLDTTARKVTLDLFQSVILRSPVGNPDTWKANRGAAHARESHNVFAELLNTQAQSDPANFTKRGKFKGKLIRTKSARALAAAYPNRSGKGYVGGRFRANWVASFGQPARTTHESTDRSLSEAEAIKGASFQLGGKVYFCNSLPYAIRLENGWSQQAPAGMVKLTLAQAEVRIRQAIHSK